MDVSESSKYQNLIDTIWESFSTFKIVGLSLDYIDTPLSDLNRTSETHVEVNEISHQYRNKDDTSLFLIDISRVTRDKITCSIFIPLSQDRTSYINLLYKEKKVLETFFNYKDEIYHHLAEYLISKLDPQYKLLTINLKIASTEFDISFTEDIEEEEEDEESKEISELHITFTINITV